MAAEPVIDLDRATSDEVLDTTCYMCAGRCGIRVHMSGGKLRYIEGNRKHPVNRGVLCAKGAAGIMQHSSPARLKRPLLRTGPRGSGEFREISWEEALTIATERLAAIRARDPRQLAFFTGRDQSQALTGWWAQQFGTPNYAAHGGFCSVNMAAAGLYTLGGSFWEFGEPDWERTRYLLLFGVAEDHASNPLKLGLARLKERGAKVVSVNPVRSGYSALADEWVPVRPGRDGLLVLALVHELLRTGRIDRDSLLRYSNAAWLVIEAPGTAEDGLFARDGEGRPLAIDRDSGLPQPAESLGGRAALEGRAEIPAPDGADPRTAVTVFQLLAERYGDRRYAPEAVARDCGIAAGEIRRLAQEIAAAAFDSDLVLEQPWTDAAGERHARMVGRPVSFHAMRGISAHSNGFQTCRALHLLQLLLGSVDAPGGWRFKPPYPRPIPPALPPGGKPGEVVAGQPLPRPPLGFPQGPEDLLVEPDGTPSRIDKAFSWEAPLAVHGQIHSVIANAHAGDPYPIDTLFFFMANMAWNSSMDIAGVERMLTDREPETGAYRIPFIIYADAFFSETVAYADLVLPDTTYLERWDAMSLLDRPIGDPDFAGDSIRRPVVEPDREVRAFQSVLLDLGARLGLPGMVDEAGRPLYPGGYPDYLVHHQRRPGIGTLAGWRGEAGEGEGRGAPNPHQLEAYIAAGCFWQHHFTEEERFFKHANRAYLERAVALGFFAEARPVVFQLYSEVLQRFRLAARGQGPVVAPAGARTRLEAACDPLPVWWPPFEDESQTALDFPLHAVTQRPMPMYHSWGSQNAWLRQLMTRNRLYLPLSLAEELGLAAGDWALLESRNGRVAVEVQPVQGVESHTVWTWNAIGKRAGAWLLDPAAPEARDAFLLNDLIGLLLPPEAGQRPQPAADPVTGQAAWYDLRVRLRPLAAGEREALRQIRPPISRPDFLPPAPARLP